MQYSIIFKLESGGEHKLSAALGDNILSLAIKAGVAIDAPCSGNGTCGKCRLRLISGSVDVIPNPKLSAVDLQDGWRLACQSNVAGDAVFLVPAAAGAFKRGIRTADLSSAVEQSMYSEAMGKIFSSGIHRGVAGSAAGEYGLAVDIEAFSDRGDQLVHKIRKQQGICAHHDRLRNAQHIDQDKTQRRCMERHREHDAHGMEKASFFHKYHLLCVSYISQ